MARKSIAVVVPIFNEAAIIDTLYARLAQVSERQPYDFRFIFVNDGSTDDTLAKLSAASAQDPRVTVLDLARNFGHHPALTAGIDHADADALILMDADLEDNPDHIDGFIRAWEQGADVVYAVRAHREAGWVRRLGFAVYHRLNRHLEMHMAPAGVFSLIDRRVANALRQMPERRRYIPGLRSWTGFRQVGIAMDRGHRYDQEPRVSLGRLLRLALDSYVSFSTVPLKLASLMGLLSSVVGFIAIVFIVVYQLILGFQVSGWSSLIVTVIFASGVQLLCVGILGEYIAQILEETKRRPVYIVRARIQQGAAEDA